MSTTQFLYTHEINGLPLRVWLIAERLWVRGEDLFVLLDYRSDSGLRKAYSAVRARLESHSIKCKIENKGHASRFYDDVALRFLCSHRKHQNALHLLNWLDAGGMSIEGVHTEPALTDSSNVLAFKATNSAPPAGQSERQRAYCRDLLKTLLRYATDAETEELTHTIESEVVDLLNRRHCPGLNDARYELYRRFWLSGGEV